MLVEQHSSQISSPNMEDSLQIQQQSHIEKITLKDQAKKPFFTLPNIIIILCLIVLAAVGTYSLMNTNQDKQIKSGINNSHEKIIQNADSSKKDSTNSQTSSSKSSTATTKPHQKSLPASKSVISSNPAHQTGKGDEPDDNEQDNGDKRDKKLKKGSSTEGGSSNQQDSQDYEDDSENEEAQQGQQWVNTNLQGNGAPPLVGSARP